MAKRGRPPTGGVKEGRVLIRASFVLAEFQKARERGAKYEAAVTSTVKRMREHFPDESFSATELKRILREFQPKNADEVFQFEEDADGRGGTMSIRPRKNLRVNRKNRSKSVNGNDSSS